MKKPNILNINTKSISNKLIGSLLSDSAHYINKEFVCFDCCLAHTVNKRSVFALMSLCDDLAVITTVKSVRERDQSK